MKRVVAALALTLLAAACGGGSDPRASIAPDPGPAATEAGQGSAATQGSTPVPARPGGIPALPPDATVSGTPFPLADFVKAEVPEDEAWGQACFVPRAGSACTVPFEGVAYLANRDEGQIALLAFENRSETPAAVRLLPADKGVNRLCFERGCPHGGAWLPYAPGVGAETATFLVELRDMNGAVLARSFPRTFEIH